MRELEDIHQRQRKEELREVYHDDALIWMAARGEIPGASFVTSLPDYSEFPGKTLDEWKDWFVNAASLVFASSPAEGCAIFYQRDTKQDGVWVDKSYLIQKAAERSSSLLLWHKIICRVPPGNITFGKPAYSHLLCFSRALRHELKVSTADVVPEAGKVSWPRGMGVNACRIACRFILEQTSTRTLVNPFCGHGTLLAVANEMGLKAVGVELSRKRAEKAERLTMKDLGGDFD